VAQGTTTVDFGAFPGKTDATATVSGQAGITGTSLVEAWIFPTATADHSRSDSRVIRNIDNPRVYGQWTVAWVWN